MQLEIMIITTFFYCPMNKFLWNALHVCDDDYSDYNNVRSSDNFRSNLIIVRAISV